MNYSSKQKGFTLTEIMVAVAIGLIGTLVVFKAFQSTNVIAKNASGGADASTIGNIALFSIERDARMAGYGINDAKLVGCKILMRSTSVTLPSNIIANSPGTGNGAFAPALILGTTAQPVLRLAYAGGRSIAPTTLTQAHGGTSSEIMRVINLYGLKEAGTMILLTQENAASTLTPKAGSPCTILQTSKDFLSDTDRDLQTNSSGLSPFSPPSGSAQPYALGADVFNIGALTVIDSNLPANSPVWREYIIDPATETLQEKNLFVSSSHTVVSNNITNMYVDYMMRDGTTRTGLSNGSTAPELSGVLSTGTQAAKDAQIAEMRNVIGLRVSLLVRQPAPDYSKGSECKNPADESAETLITNQNSDSLSTGFQDNAGNDIRFALTRTYNSNAFCYRYKAQSTTVMMRNLLW